LIICIAISVCSLGSVRFSPFFCPIKGDDDTTLFKDDAHRAKWRYVVATYCFALGISLLAAGCAMPWMSFSADLSLPLLASTCLKACNVSGASERLCQGGTLSTAGSVFCYLSMVVGAAAFGMTWVASIRSRNLAHHGTLSPLIVCGDIPVSLYVGIISSLLALLGVILSWVGYNSIIGAFPEFILQRLGVTAPPGGISLIFGMLMLVCGCGAVWWSHSALNYNSATKIEEPHEVLEDNSAIPETKIPTEGLPEQIVQPRLLWTVNPLEIMKEEFKSSLPPLSSRKWSDTFVIRNESNLHYPEGWLQVSDGSKQWWVHRETGVTSWIKPTSPRRFSYSLSREKLSPIVSSVG